MGPAKFWKHPKLNAKTHCSILVLKTDQHKDHVGPATLAKNWGISILSAKCTIAAMMQCGLCTILHPTLSHCFCTNNRQLLYRRIGHDMFMDTLKAQTTTWFQKNKYAQVFFTSFRWARAYPMKRKSDAHEGFSLLAQCDGVPITIICDNAKEQIMGKFCCKCCEVGMCVKQTKPHTPWSNAAEGTIWELKCRAGQKMAKSSCPAKLWDHCLELKAYIRLHTALDKYELQGQVPKTIMSAQTADNPHLLNSHFTHG